MRARQVWWLPDRQEGARAAEALRYSSCRLQAASVERSGNVLISPTSVPNRNLFSGF